MKPIVANVIEHAQRFLESCYGVNIPERAIHFCSSEHKVATLGTVLCHSNFDNGDIEISVLLDRDYFSASLESLTHGHYSVIFEEVSHFYLLGTHHRRGTQVTQLELEAQSEIDRLMCCLSLDPHLSRHTATHLRDKLFYERYADPAHERARKLASSFLGQLSSSKPHSWRNSDFAKINQFFNSDLAGKFSLARCF